jgi:hypothetical protein
MVGLPLGVLLAALPFMVRGYVLTEGHIEVLRLGKRVAQYRSKDVDVEMQPGLGFRGLAKEVGQKVAPFAFERSQDRRRRQARRWQIFSSVSP